MEKKVSKKYQTIDELFSNPKYTSISEDVRRQVVEEKYQKPIPFSNTVVGRQVSQWSGLLNKTL